MKKLFISSIILLIYSYSLAQENGRILITNGFPIDISEAPYQVSIYSSNGNHFCGGSIINNHYVLTAAHCVAGVNAPDITVNVGFDDQDNPGNNIQSYNVSNIFVHPNNDPNTNDFDVAVLEIDGTFSFNNFVQPVELITDQSLFAENVGNISRVSGWGWTIEGQPSIANDLQAVDVPIITNQQADQQLDISFPNHPQLSDQMISTDAQTTDREGACHADSGGPLVFQQDNQNDIQIGVVSWGVPTCVGGDNSPSIYARLSELTDWINGQVWSYARISGTNVVCAGLNQNFSLENVPELLDVDWSSSNNVQIISSNNFGVTIRASSSSTSGTGGVNATLSNGVVINNEFWVGRPSYSNSQIQGSSSQVGLYSSDQLSVSQANGVTSYQWTIVDDYNSCPGSSGPYFWAYGTGTTQVTTSSRYIGINYGSCSGTFRLRCRAINNCGSRYYNDFVVTVGSSAPCNSTLTLSRNPSANGVIILRKAPAPCDYPISTLASSTEPTGMSFTVFDMSGNPVLTGESKIDTHELNVSQLKNGRYIIHVLTPKKQLLKSSFIIK